ncbi:hypothetical protein [uncultured Paraprevotella sp.]|uniref:hypothetical protein n=1 Tax=Paraprevotella clara TaxID=454154 RepID=UPI00259BDE4C|nr:hypothetical protein [uncultured Paraprevotella sp.]
MEVRCFLYSCILLLGLGGEVVSAQTFRRIKNVRELEDGAHYVLAGYCAAHPDSLYVMASQDKTGTGKKNRAARKLPLDKNGRIYINDGGTAIFELSVEGKAYAFRDIVLDAWLAYTTGRVQEYASLLTLTDEELTRLPAKPNNKYSNRFEIIPSASARLSKTPLYTKEDIFTSVSSKKQFGLMPVGGISFKLCEQDVGDSLFIYKEEVQSPTLERREDGDWTFKGDWLADSLFALDYAQARRIDFTEIALPQGKSMVSDGKMPKGYVWTYVRKGEAGRLPEGWSNVVEIDRKDEGIQGNAVTRMVGCDSCTLGPKYTFTVPEETGIVWYRKAENDGGWLTVGLPYAVKKVAWEDADGETITSERLCFEEITGDGAVFREMEADEAWQAGMPYLWRPSEPRESVVCFYGEDTVVQPQESDVETTDGFYAVFGRYDIKDDGKTVFLLDDSGTRFVRAAAGSWVAPGRGYLVYTGTAFHSVRLIENELPAGAEGIETRMGGCLLPVYGTDGIKRGEICPGGHIPEEWPEGMYITPFGKMIKK